MQCPQAGSSCAPSSRALASCRQTASSLPVPARGGTASTSAQEPSAPGRRQQPSSRLARPCELRQLQQAAGQALDALRLPASQGAPHAPRTPRPCALRARA